MASLSPSHLSPRVAKRSSDWKEARGLAPSLLIGSASFRRLKVAVGKRSSKRGFGVQSSAGVLEERRRGEEEEEVVEERPLKVGIVCGGPSAERGISLNSARSVLDHIRVADIVGSNRFWDNVDLALKLFSPLVKVLRRVDGDKPSMGFLYDDLERAKEDIKKNLDSKEKKYIPIWNIIDKRWEDKLKGPLHRAGHYLNPYTFYKKKMEIEKAGIFMDGLVEVMHRFYPEKYETLNKITDQLALYQYQKGSFGRDWAKKGAENLNLNPANWWMMHGTDAPELREMTMRVLNLTTSSSGCERNWSTFETGGDLLVSCYYIDCDLNAYAISPAQLYSNTPADFDFKLGSLARGFRSLSEFADHLTLMVDIVFPVIHGRFGEDGGIQELLEKANVPFVGTPSAECRQAFDKYNASIELSRQGFVTVPSFLIQENQADKSKLAKWFDSNELDKDTGKVVVKPARAGSSIGVAIAHGVDDSIKKALDIISEGIDDRVLIEFFLDGGSEFTAIVMDTGMGTDCKPVVLLPTEVELCGNNDVNEDAIFNYRRKYLPTQQVAYHTPPRFPTDVIECIREGAALLFQRFGLRDFARIDGWFLPSHLNMLSSPDNVSKFGETKSGTIIFTDINLISGMEQTSFLFQQASKVGFSHSNILRTVIQRACLRFPSLRRSRNAWNALARRLKSTKPAKVNSKNQGAQKVFVIFGGDTSERQVSLMSGTNVWLNLQAFDDLDVLPCLLAPANGYLFPQHQDIDHHSRPRSVWSLPYSLVLRHTTEEVFNACIEAIEPTRAAQTSHLRDCVMTELAEAMSKHSWFTGFDIVDEPPMEFSLEQWINFAKESQAVVFIAVHGGIGEDGTLQTLLEAAGVPYTGPGPLASKICMDKVSTSLALNNLAGLGLLTIPKDVRSKEELLNSPIPNIWQDLSTKLLSESLCVKPARDGCSTGVARLRSAEDLKVYVNALRDSLPRLPANSLSKAHGVIEMPNPPPGTLIFEPFIETDEIIFSSKTVNDSNRLVWKGDNEWIEVTVGVVGKHGEMRPLSPSITVKETGDILSLEEKFQGGTGINLTPPPTTIIRNEVLQRCKQRIELAANTLGLEGFSRIDAFVNVQSGEVLVIEVNTVPGMTPSTVLIHQALAEQPPMYPHQFFRTLLDLSFHRSK